jgi:SAM-dependent methyltransferase
MIQPQVLLYTLDNEIHKRVGFMYENFPYPHYPLLLPLRWQDGYLASSQFVHRLLEAKGLAGYPHEPCAPGSPLSRKILVAGCGEVLPYILRSLEPENADLYCVDLSMKSLQRARIRTLLTTGRIHFYQSDIELYLENCLEEGVKMDHVDCYGLLHHTTTPDSILKKMAQILCDCGTLRLMVYNQPARRWLYHLKKGFLLLGLSPYAGKDLSTARSLIELLKREVPLLGQYLNQIPADTYRISERFVDTFFHEHEAQIAPAKWFSFMQAAGFEPFGLFDRYAELDDLVNPLWHMPSVEELEERAYDRRFENNLEVYAYKPRPQGSPAAASGIFQRHAACGRQRLRFKAPPLSWFGYEETRRISLFERYVLWNRFVENTYFNKRRPFDDVVKKWPLKTVQRLARIGVIMEDQLVSRELKEGARAPLCDRMEPPDDLAVTAAENTQVKVLIDKILIDKGHKDFSKRRELVFRHLQRAQMSLKSSSF